MDFNNTYHISHHRPKYLSPFIYGFSIYHFTDNAPVRLNPEGYFELIFQLNGGFHQKPTDTGDWVSRPEFFVGGLHNKSFNIRPEKKGSKLISVNFKPQYTRFFIPDKLHVYKNKVVELNDIFRLTELKKIEPLQNNGHPENKLDLIESFLGGIFKDKSTTTIDRALHIIFQKNGFVNIRELAEKSCLSISQFRKRFNEEVGMSPKEYTKIIRIRYISEFLSQHPSLNLTQLTYKLGYFDQSHFIKDFKSVTGVSPKNYSA
ncbi:MAG: helix-turn-helix transcriptional regulator [Bacteroidales bacterium]